MATYRPWIWSILARFQPPYAIDQRYLRVSDARRIEFLRPRLRLSGSISEPERPFCVLTPAADRPELQIAVDSRSGILTEIGVTWRRCSVDPMTDRSCFMRGEPACQEPLDPCMLGSFPTLAPNPRHPHTRGRAGTAVCRYSAIDHLWSGLPIYFMALMALILRRTVSTQATSRMTVFQGSYGGKSAEDQQGCLFIEPALVRGLVCRGIRSGGSADVFMDCPPQAAECD